MGPMSPRERIAGARLYLVCDARSREFLAAAIRGGVDVVQLRDKALGDEALVTAAREFRAAADAGGALFVLNDRPDLVAACAADGVHVGQDDGSPAQARAAVGADAIVGRSTHAPDQCDAADADPEVDYLAVGPVHATPTKPGRPAAGAEYVAWAADHLATPWFAIGGLDEHTAPAAMTSSTFPASSPPIANHGTRACAAAWRIGSTPTAGRPGLVGVACTGPTAR